MGTIYFEEKTKALVVQDIEAQVIHLSPPAPPPPIIEKTLLPEIIIQKETVYIENKCDCVKVLPDNIVYHEDIVPLEEQIEELFLLSKEMNEHLEKQKEEATLSYQLTTQHILLIKQLLDETLQKINMPPVQKHWSERYSTYLAIGGAIVASILINILL